MKKLMIVALLALGATAFAAETNTTAAISTTNTQVTTMSLGESFMVAFGMGDTSVAGGSTAEGGNGGTGADGNNATVSTTGAVSAATNVATTIANNSTTIVTPYGKY